MESVRAEKRIFLNFERFDFRHIEGASVVCLVENDISELCVHGAKCGREQCLAFAAEQAAMSMTVNGP